MDTRKELVDELGEERVRELEDARRYIHSSGNPFGSDLSIWLLGIATFAFCIGVLIHLIGGALGFWVLPK